MTTGNGIGTTWKGIIIMVPILAAVFYGGRLYGDQATRLHKVEENMATLLSKMDQTLQSSRDIQDRVSRLEWNLERKYDKP